MKRAKNIRIDEIKRLIIKPGDVLLVKTNKRTLEPGEAKKINDMFKMLFPDTIVVLHDDTLEISVVGPTKLKATR